MKPKIIIKSSLAQYFYKLPQFKATAETNGKGLWSSRVKSIKHNRADINFYRDYSEPDVASEFESGKPARINSAELRVYFTKKDWETSKHGLIYSDKAWIKDLRSHLVKMGYSTRSAKSVDYSEQGMQGTDYVSLDVSKQFLKETATLLFGK
jgi:hypothetical protein